MFSPKISLHTWISQAIHRLRSSVLNQCVSCPKLKLIPIETSSMRTTSYMYVCITVKQLLSEEEESFRYVNVTDFTSKHARVFLKLFKFLIALQSYLQLKFFGNCGKGEYANTHFTSVHITRTVSTVSGLQSLILFKFKIVTRMQ